MISRRGFIAGLLALPIVAKLEPVARAILPRFPGLLGVKAQELLDAGFVWAPYIPIIYTETILTPDSLEIHDRLHRYEKSELRTDYYGKVKI